MFNDDVLNLKEVKSFGRRPAEPGNKNDGRNSGGTLRQKETKREKREKKRKTKYIGRNACNLKNWLRTYM